MSYEVELYPEESAFIDVVYAKRMNQDDGRGEFIAPSVGPLIYLEEFSGLTESAVKFALLVRLNHNIYHSSGRVGMRFVNFNYQEPIPKVVVDSNAEDLWGVKRTTVDGRPLNDFTGLVINEFIHEKVINTTHKWDEKKKEYVPHTSTEDESCFAQGFVVSNKLVEA